MTGWDVSGITDMTSIFQGCAALASLDCIKAWEPTSLETLTNAFNGCTSLTDITALKDWDFSTVKTITSIFRGCTGLKNIDCEWKNFAPGVNGTADAFNGCSPEKIIVNGWDISEMTAIGNISSTFNGVTADAENGLAVYAERWKPSAIVFTGAKTNAGAFQPIRTAVTELHLANWDLTDVKPTTLANMFYGFTKLKTLDVTGWDTSAVTTMASAFSGCAVLETIEGIDGWNVSVVTTMASAFQNCAALRTLDLSKWEPNALTNISSAFNGCATLDKLDCSWENFGGTSNVTTASAFAGCSSMTDLDISGWSVKGAAIGNLQNMFTGMTSLKNLKAANWKNVLAARGNMFTNLAGSLETLDVSNWTDAAAPTTLANMFSGLTKLKTLDASGWNTAKVTNMSNAFLNCRSLTDLTLTGWDTSAVTNMASAFQNCRALNKIPDEFLSKKVLGATGATYAFFGCESITGLDLSEWDMTAVTDISHMFQYASKLKTLKTQKEDGSGWNTAKVTKMTALFHGCSQLDNPDISYWNTAAVTDMDYMFNDCQSLSSFDISGWSMNAAVNISSMFRNCRSLGTLTTVKTISGEDGGTEQKWSTTTKLTGMTYIFSGCEKLKSLDLSGFNTTNVTNLSHAFSNCTELQSVTLGDNWNTAKTTNMSEMFRNCGSLEELDAAALETNALTNMSHMFDGCASIDTLDVSKWNVAAVTDMSYAFNGCASVKSLDFTGWNTDKVTADYWTDFARGCTSLTEITLGPNFGNKAPTSGLFYVPEMMYTNVLGTWSDGMKLYQWQADNRNGVAEVDPDDGKDDTDDFGDVRTYDAGTAEKIPEEIRGLIEKYDSEGFVPTDDMTAANKQGDFHQRNYRYTETFADDGTKTGYLVESAEWTDYENGEAKIVIDAVTTEGFAPIPLYVTTVCSGHGLTKAKVEKNILELAKMYGYVDFMQLSPVKTVPTQILGPTRFTYVKDVTNEDQLKKDITAAVQFTSPSDGSHYTEAVPAVIRQYIFKSLNTEVTAANAQRHPRAIYVSFDNVNNQLTLAQGQSTNNATGIFEQYSTPALYEYLAETYEQPGDDRYFSMTSDDSGRKAITAMHSYVMSPSNYVNGKLDYVSDYPYTQTFDSLGVTASGGNIAVADTIDDSIFNESVLVDRDKSHYNSGTLNFTSDGSSISVRLPSYEVGAPIHIEINAVIRDSDLEVKRNWFDVNEGSATFTDTGIMLAQVNSPQLMRYGEIGDLDISKTVVAGDDGEVDEEKEFTFDVEFSGAAADAGEVDGLYSYDISEPDSEGSYTETVTTGALTVSGNRTQIKLKHNQKARIYGLPAAVSYEVTEQAEEGYHQLYASAAASGTISSSATPEAAFYNSTDADPEYGVNSLTITKTVRNGAGAPDTDKEFVFTVTLANDSPTSSIMPEQFSYSIDGEDKGFIRSGETLTLKNGQTAVIKDIPVLSSYSVQEE